MYTIATAGWNRAEDRLEPVSGGSGGGSAEPSAGRWEGSPVGRVPRPAGNPGRRWRYPNNDQRDTGDDSHGPTGTSDAGPLSRYGRWLVGANDGRSR